MTEENAPTITVTDIAAMLRIIDTAAERGAYRGEELTAVGSVRDKAAVFVNFIREQAEALRAPLTEEEATEATEATEESVDEPAE